MPEITEEKARPVDTVLRPKKHGRTYDKVIDVIKTLPWVVPITIIIWIYAERKQVDSVKNVIFPIAVRTDAPNRIALLSDPADGIVIATLEGPTTNLQNVITLLKANPDRPAIVYTLPADTNRGTFRTQILGAIGDNPIFKNNGIKVVDPAPQQLEIAVDEIQEATVDVRPPAGSTILDGAQFSPAQVKIRAPFSMFAPDKKDLFVTAKIDTIKPGLHEHERVDVSWSHVGKNVTIEPSTVEATFTVRNQDQTKTLRGIPIFIAEPAFARTKYQITAPETLPQITFAGPKEEIDQLGEGVVALLLLHPTDLREGDQTEQLQFNFPPNIHSVHVVTNPPQNYTVPFHVTEIKQ